MTSTLNANTTGRRPDGSHQPAPLSNRGRIASFLVMDVMRAVAEKEAEGHDIVHMEVGQPGTPAPRPALEAATAAMRERPLGYTVALGNADLRARIARLYRDRYGVEVSPGNIVITTGSSAGFLLTFLSLFDEGATIGLPRPGYPCYRQILHALGQHEIPLETGPDNRWMPTVDQIARARDEHGLAGVLIASPANPTGTMLSPERLGDIAAYCDREGIWFISDEIYHGLSYGRADATAWGEGQNVIVINSFSKYHSMTGWRIGWMVVPDRLLRTIERLQQNLFISAPAVSQVAALAACDADAELDANVAVYRRNREELLAALPAAGFDRLVPADGAFYLYCDVSAFTDDSVALAGEILDDAGVAVTPGVDFDPVNGNRFIRLCYAGTNADIGKAIARLTAWSCKRAK